MTPVFQTIHGGGKGNCFAACVASILDLQIRDVPHFMEKPSPDYMWTQEQWDSVREFSQGLGYRACWIDPDTEPGLASMLFDSGLHYIATGPSKGGNWGHCVVMKGYDYVHDPANSGFLAGPPWLFVVLDPA